EVDAPPGIVYEEAAPMIQDSIVDMRRRVPEWRARGIIRLELVGSFAILHRPVTGQYRALYPAHSDIERADQLAVVVDSHGLFDHRDHQHLSMLEARIMLHHLQVGLMHLVVRGL